MPCRNEAAGSLSTDARVPVVRAVVRSPVVPCVSTGPRTRTTAAAPHVGRRSSSASPVRLCDLDQLQALDRRRAERVERTLDVLQEHAQRFSRPSTGPSARRTRCCAIRPTTPSGPARSGFISGLKRTQQAVPAHRGDLGFRPGGPAAGGEHRLPGAESPEQRRPGLFQGAGCRERRTFIGDVIRPGSATSLLRGQPAAASPDGLFNGVIAVTVPPASFQASMPASRAGPRFRQASSGPTAPSSPATRIPAACRASGPETASAGRSRPRPRAASSWHLPDRRHRAADRLPEDPGLRRLRAGRLPHDAIRRNWSTMAGHLLFGLPATALLSVLTFLALRRTHDSWPKPSAARPRRSGSSRRSASRRSGSSPAASLTTSTTS